MIRALALALAVFLMFVASDRLSQPRTLGATDDGTHLEAERRRIRRHLEAVEQRLRAADVSHLTTEQRAARAAQLDVLREYRLAGRFPHNHGVSAGRIPIFVDEHGTHCAVGYLLARAGETEIVSRISATRNLATIAQLAAEPGLLEWLKANGLTAEEAGQIQPQYSPPEHRRERDGTYLAATLALSAVSAGSATWNVLAGSSENLRYLRGLSGLVSGLASVGWGVEGLRREESEWAGGINTNVLVTREPTSADVAINLIAGALSGVLGTRTLILNRSALVEEEQASGEERAAMSLEIAPTPRGLTASLRF
jgi:hypothetical protein